MLDLREWIHDAAVTRAFYGSVVYAAVVTVFASEQVQPPVTRAIGGVVATAVILYIAHGFSELVPRIVHAGRLARGDVAHVAVAELPLLIVALVPIAPLAAGAWGVLATPTAYRLSVVVTLVALFVLATALCVRNGLSWARSLGAGIGILVATSVVIWLEALVTH
jgi:hypothetical protein